jgi:hypothetical protein
MDLAEFREKGQRGLKGQLDRVGMENGGRATSLLV